MSPRSHLGFPKRWFAVLVVLIMLMAGLSGLTRNAAADTGTSAPTATSTSSSSVANGTSNSTAFPALNASVSQSTSLASALTSPFPAGVISGQNTYVFNFDATAEGFTKPTDYPYSDVHWDSANKRVYVYSDRRDAGDEMFVRTTDTLDTSSDFTVTARWTATVQGNWQYVYPVFLTASGNTTVLTANSIVFRYASRDSNLGWTPYYFMYYKDASNTFRISTFYEGQVNTEYHFLVNYDSETRMLTMEIRSAADVTLKFARYRIGTNPNDGFTLGKIGTSTNGWSSTYEPTTTAWVDDIVLTYASGSFRDATQDKGDQSTKIGWLADNFNDNTNEIWTVEYGTVAWQSGMMKMNPNAAVHAGTSWFDQKIEFKLTFTTDGGAIAYFRYKDSSNWYALIVGTGPSAIIALQRSAGGNVVQLYSFTTPVNLGSAYRAKVVAAGNSFEMWWDGVLKWSGTDPSPPSAITGNVRFTTGSTAYVSIDDLRLWNTAAGSETKAVRDAGTVNKPLQTQIAGAVDAFNQVHLQVRSSSDNVVWGPWTNLKSDVKAGSDYPLPDQDRQRYYQIRTVLTSGVESTPAVTSVTTQEGTPTTNPTANTGFEAWYPYVGGLVNAVNGNLWFSTTDLSLRAKGFTLSVARSYNSLRGSTSGPFGNGWTFNYNEYLTVNGDNSVTWNDGDGSQHTFWPKATATGPTVQNNPTAQAGSWSGGANGFSSDNAYASTNTADATHTYSGFGLSGPPDWGVSKVEACVEAYTAGDDDLGVKMSTDGGATWSAEQIVNLPSSDPNSLTCLDFTAHKGAWSWDDLSDGKFRVQVRYVKVGSQRSYDYLDWIPAKVSTVTGGGYDAPRGVPSRLVNSADGTFTLWHKDGSRALFTSAGQMSSLVDKNGNALTLTYSSGRLTSVADASGKALNFGYDGSGRIVRAWDPDVTVVQKNATSQSGNWINGQNAFRSDDAYATKDGTGSADHTYWAYGFSGPANDWITKVEVCVEAFRIGGDDALGVWVSANGGSTWSPGKAITALPGADPNSLTCLDFTSYKTSWSWTDLSDSNFRVMVMYVKVGPKTDSTLYLDWVPVRVSTRTRSVQYSYDGSGNLYQVTDVTGLRVEQYTYASGRLTELTDHTGTGRWVNFTYDASNRATEIWTGKYQSGTVAWKYRLYGIAYSTTTTRTITNAGGYTTTLTLNSFGNPTNATGPSVGCAACDGTGNTTSYMWDGEMNRIRVTDGRGFFSSTNLDFRSNVISSIDAGGNVSSMTWSEANSASQYVSELLSRTTFRGYTMRLEYDAKGNAAKIVDAKGNFASFLYDNYGFLNKSTDFRGYSTWYEINSNGYLVKVTNPLSEVTRYEYDAWGRTTRITSPMSFVSSYEYDKEGRQTKVTDPLGNFTSYGYNIRGDLIATTDPDGYTTSFQVNVTNRKVQVQTDALGNSTTNAYDLRGNLLTVTDANAHVTRYEYDTYDRLTKITTPKGYVDGFFTSYAYDAAGNRLRRTDANGAATVYTYDKLGRLSTTKYPGGSSVTQTYDDDGNLLSAVGLGYTQTIAYDELGRAVSITFDYESFQKTTTYTYDANGNRLTMKDAEGGTTSYAYDAANRQRQITDPENRITPYVYDKDSRTVSITYPNGVKTTNTWDASSRLTEVNTTKVSDNSVIESFKYSYDKAGNRLSVKLKDGSVTSYEYDKLHRLVKMTEPGPYTTTYTYDAVGNLLRETPGPTYVYDTGNRDALDDRLTKIDWGGSIYIGYTYDNNGNRKREGNPSRGYSYFSYDCENRLISGYSYTHTYAPTGERASTAYTSTTYYGQDFAALGGVSDVIAEYDGTGTRQARYTQGPGADEPIGVLRSGAYYTYQKDGLGSVTRITDASQNPVNTYTYSPWGDTSGGGTLANPFQYTGREKDSASGSALYHYRARVYDPAARRFLSRDPMGTGDGTSRYAYVGNNPVNWIDPCGHQRRRDGGIPGPVSTSSAANRDLCNALWAIAIINLVGGLVFGTLWSAFAGSAISGIAGAGAATIGAHVALSVWIPEITIAVQHGDVLGAFAVIIQLGAFILSIVAQTLQWWQWFIIPVAGAQLYGPGFVVNLIGALVGFGVALANLHLQGCW